MGEWGLEMQEQASLADEISMIRDLGENGGAMTGNVKYLRRMVLKKSQPMKVAG